MSLSDAMKRLKYDKRLTENMLKYGEITEDEVNKHRESLPDDTENAETVNIFEIDNEDRPQSSQQSH